MKNKKPVFKVIEGGLKKKAFQPGNFISAKAVKSRLMGVTGLIIHRFRREPETELDINIYQLFYFDAEEYGFDSYRSFFIPEKEGAKLHSYDNDENLQKQMAKMFGGLGSTYVEITEREAEYLVCHYAKFNKKRKIVFPIGREEYDYILDKNTLLSDEEIDNLMHKICVEITSDTELINYFVMRYVGKDFEAAKWLYKGNLRTDLFPFAKPCTLLRNSIEEGPTGDTLCQSLIETDGSHYLAVSKISTADDKVTEFQQESLFRISPEEANMILSRENFLIVFRVSNNPEQNVEYVEKLFPGALINNHNNGTLLTVFNRNNNHVKRPIYRLDNDVMAMILITFAGEMIISSSDAFKCALACETLFNSNSTRKRPGEPDNEKIGAYRFSTSLIPPFLNSGFMSFEDFINRIITT